MKNTILISVTMIFLSVTACAQFSAKAQLASMRSPYDAELREARNSRLMNAELTQADASKLSVTLKAYNPTSEKLRVTITGNDGEVFSRDYSSVAFSQSFNFTGMPEGSYTFLLVCGKQRVKKRFTIELRRSETTSLLLE